MRILFATYAEKTHFLGMVPLAWALQTAGHEVRVASQPELTGVITGAGLTAVPVGRDHNLHLVLKQAEAIGGGPAQTTDGDADDPERFDFAENRPEVLTWEYVSAGYRDVVPWWFRLVNGSMVDDLVTFCRQWQPDLVLWEPVTFAGAIAATAVGAAHGRVMWSVDLFARMRGHLLRRLAEQPPARREDLLAQWLGARMARYGGQFSEVLTTGQFTVDTVPDSLRLDPTLGLDLGLDYLPMRYVPYNGASVVPNWLREPARRPRVALTLGVSSTERLDGYAISVQDILDALADLDIEVVATLPEAQQAELGRVPDNARLVDFAPLGALAPTCAAVIHHGGNGTYCTTLLHGVPQLVVPFFFDGTLRAEWLAAQGAGLAMRRSAVTAAGIREGVRRLLGDPSFAYSAARLRAEMLSLPAPGDLVPQIEKRAAAYR